MSAVAADTHAIIWYLGDPSSLSPTALQAMRQTVTDGDIIYVSVISLVEIIYLVEKGRLLPTAQTGLKDAIDRPESSVKAMPVYAAIASALESIPREQVPDMPDRIIAATALHLGVPLVTWDGRIRSRGITTIW